MHLKWSAAWRAECTLIGEGLEFRRRRRRQPKRHFPVKLFLLKIKKNPWINRRRARAIFVRLPGVSGGHSLSRSLINCNSIEIRHIFFFLFRIVGTSLKGGASIKREREGKRRKAYTAGPPVLEEQGREMVSSGTFHDLITFFFFFPFCFLLFRRIRRPNLGMNKYQI